MTRDDMIPLVIVYLRASTCLDAARDLLAVASPHRLALIDEDGVTWRWRRTAKPKMELAAEAPGCGALIGPEGESCGLPPGQCREHTGGS